MITELRCRDCQWYVERNQKSGECHRYSPYMDIEGTSSMSAYPIVDPLSPMCGEGSKRGKPTRIVNKGRFNK